VSSDEAVAPTPEVPDEMVRHLQPTWTPEAFTRLTDGVNTTVVVDVDTPDGARSVVLKASTSDHPLAADRARAEPHVLSLVGRETAVPVPTVCGSCDDHGTYPTPYFLMAYVDGATISQDRAPTLPAAVRETIFREAGRNLAGLHALGPLAAVGDLVGRDGTVTVLDTPASPSYDSFHRDARWKPTALVVEGIRQDLNRTTSDNNPTPTRQPQDL
jgi:aminoglycoside phosphotransferase (APT) family kinase protein